MKFNFKDILLPAIILSIICFCATALLVLTNELTKDQIALAQEETVRASRMIVMSDADNFEEIDANTVKALKGDEAVGYIFVTQSSGYAGAISVMTGIDLEQNITGIVILEQTETPGLGANCTKADFTEQFKQMATELTVIKNQTAGEAQVEALTGATVTSEAVTNAVNEAIGLYSQIVGG